MQKKILLGLLLLSLIILLNTTFAYAADESGKDSLEKAANSVRNVVGDAENGIEDAARGISNTSKDMTGDMENDASKTSNFSGAMMTNSTNQGNYQATRTATTTSNTFLGMNSTTWIWLILAIAAVAIVALVYYYSSGVSRTNNYNDNNE